MADKTDLERAVDEMLSDLGKRAKAELMQQIEPVESVYWEAEYWVMKDKYDQMVSKLEELVRTYCG